MALDLCFKFEASVASLQLCFAFSEILWVGGDLSLTYPVGMVVAVADLDVVVLVEVARVAWVVAVGDYGWEDGEGSDAEHEG